MNPYFSKEAYPRSFEIDWNIELQTSKIPCQEQSQATNKNF